MSSYKIGFSISKKYGEDGCKCALKQTSLIIVFAAIVAVIEYITQNRVFFLNGASWQAFRATSIYGHPIRLGTSLTIGLAIFAYLYKKSWRRIALILIALFGIYASGSRSSWLALVAFVGMIVVAVYRRRITKKKLLVGAGIVAVVVIFLVSHLGKTMLEFIRERFLQALDDNDVSSNQRLGALQYVWNDEIENFNLFTFLFGHGEDAAANLMLKTQIYISDFSSTDNEYVLIAYNYGFVFLGVIFFGVFICIKRFIMKYDYISNVEKTLLLICISQAVCCFFYEITENKSCAFLIMCSIGMLMALQRDKKMSKRICLFNKNDKLDSAGMRRW